MALADNLVSYWALDEASGNATDEVGSNTLTNTGVTFAAGKINNGADFEASETTDALSIADGSQTGLDFSTAMSLNLWVKFESDTGSENWLVNKLGSAGNRGYDFWFDASANSDLRLRLSGDGTALVTSDSDAWSPTNGVWYMVTVTYDAGDVIFYVDGSVLTDTSNSVTSINNGDGAFILGNTAGGGGGLDGMMDEVGVWSRALTPTEITALYNSGNGLAYPFSGDVVLTADLATFTLTGNASVLSRGITFVAGIASFVITGLANALASSAIWTRQSKNSTSWTPGSKNSSSWNNETKNSSSWNNQSKS